MFINLMRRLGWVRLSYAIMLENEFDADQIDIKHFRKLADYWYDNWEIAFKRAQAAELKLAEIQELLNVK